MTLENPRTNSALKKKKFSNWERQDINDKTFGVLPVTQDPSGLLIIMMVNTMWSVQE